METALYAVIKDVRLIYGIDVHIRTVLTAERNWRYRMTGKDQERKEAIRYIENQIRDGYIDLNSLDEVEMDIITCALKQYEQQKWIPCSERYPEENQICIVTDETMKNTYEYRFCKETYDENQGWTYLKHRIIAWMPLPKPYQEDKQ